MLVGLVLGLAIYNSVLLDFPLPIALYKKLVGQPPTLRDLSDMEPTVGKSLRELLNYSGARHASGRLQPVCGACIPPLRHLSPGSIVVRAGHMQVVVLHLCTVWVSARPQ
jgi:hypothetical protein